MFRTLGLKEFIKQVKRQTFCDVTFHFPAPHLQQSFKRNSDCETACSKVAKHFSWAEKKLLFSDIVLKNVKVTLYIIDSKISDSVNMLYWKI